MSTTMNPLSQIVAVEANLVNALTAAANQLDAVGTTNVNAAMDRLKASAATAHARLAATVADLTSIVGEVAQAFAATARGILGQLALNGVAKVEPATVVENTTVEPTTQLNCAVALTDDALVAAQEASQDTQEPEPTAEPASEESAATASQDGTATIKEILMVEQTDNGTIEPVEIRTAANAPVERDDRRPLPDLTTSTSNTRKRTRRGRTSDKT